MMRPLARSLGAVHGAPLGRTPRGDVIADELVIEAADRDAARAAIAEHGGVVAWASPRSSWLLARFANANDAERARAGLQQDQRIAHVAANHITEGASSSAGPSASAASWHLAAMRLPDGARADGVRVALLDTGIAYEDWSDASGTYVRAPDLAGALFAAGWDFVHDDAHPGDDHGHGTHMAAIMASTGSTRPVAPGVELMAIKVLDEENRGSELALAEGIRYAVDHGADVINLSLSFRPGYVPSRYLQEAVDHASRHGVVIVAAAGNHGADVVTYPAAFREAIAVGSSRVWDQYRSPSSSPWLLVDQFLRHADYSNRGRRIDVVAPGGDITGDADGDGMPEAVLAQTLVPGQTTRFEHRLWAGTSQAAAEVSGVVALMLAVNPSLAPHDVRAILGETARPELGRVVLSPLVGRGFLRADAAVAAAAAESTDGVSRPRFAAALHVAFIDDGGVRKVRAVVEVLDTAGQAAPGVQVYGSFHGGASVDVDGVTDADGVAVFVSPPLDGAPVVAFQVDAVSDRWIGTPSMFDRPIGALRIDSCSLEVLAERVSGSGIASSPGPVPRQCEPGDSGCEGGAGGQGIASSPGPVPRQCEEGDPGCEAGASGQGIASSPGPVPRQCEEGDPGCEAGAGGQGIASSPGPVPRQCEVGDPGCEGGASGQGIASSPRMIALRTPGAADELDSVALLNYSWTGAIVPTAIAVDPVWLAATAPKVQVIASHGAGIASSPLVLNTSEAEPGEGSSCPELIVRTFAASEGPLVLPDPARCGDAAACAAQANAIADAWEALGGIASSPGPVPSTPTPPPAQPHTLQAAIRAWATVVRNPSGSQEPHDILTATLSLARLAGPGRAAPPSFESIALSCGPELDLELADVPAGILAEGIDADGVCQAAIAADTAGSLAVP